MVSGARGNATVGGRNVASPSGLQGSADLIFVGGPILPIAGPANEVEAIAVTGDSITAVGSREQAMALRGPATRVIDLQGKTLMPGFVESHLHVLNSGLMAPCVDVSPFTLRTAAEALDKMKEAVAAAKPGEWVQGVGFDPTLMPGSEQFTRNELDAIAPNNPLWILHISEHIAYLNSLALEAAGIADTTPDPAGGRILRDATGRPNGVLQEAGAVTLIVKAAPHPEPPALVGATIGLAKQWSATGCTQVTDAGVGIAFGTAELDLMRAFAANPATPVRASGFLYGELGDQWTVAPLSGDAQMRAVKIKIVADGSTQGLTAALRQPYLNSTIKGFLNYSDEQMLDNIQKWHDKGWSLSIHCNGDAALEQVLTALETALARSPRADHRHRIEHCTVNDDAQIERMARIGVTPSFLIGHVHYWGDVFRDSLLGPERAAHLDPTGTAVRLGIPFSLHCDLITTPLKPLRYVQTAVTRRTRDSGQVVGPNQCVSVDEALKAITIYPAWQLHRDDEIGSLEAGKLADLVILDQNPRTVDPMTIAEIGVAETWLGGKQVYQRSG